MLQRQMRLARELVRAAEQPVLPDPLLQEWQREEVTPRGGDARDRALNESPP